MSEVIGLKAPQTIAIFETGEGRGPIGFAALETDNGYLGFGEDELYTYHADLSDKMINGTIFIRNTKTGEYKSVPVHSMMEITRTNKITQQFSSQGEGPKAQELIEQFGTRAAQRIIKQRNSGGQ